MKKIKKLLTIILTVALIASLLPSVVMAEAEKKGTEIDGIYVPYGTCLDYYTEEDIKNASDKLFSMLDPESEDTKDIYTLYKGGHHLEAMILFRNYMIDRVRATPITGVLMNTGGYSWERWYEHAYILIGEWDIDERNKKWQKERPEFNDLYDAFGYLNYIDPDLKMDLDWTKVYLPDADKAGKDQLSRPIYGGICGRIASAYARTGNEKFVKKFFQVMESYATQYRPQIESIHRGYSEMTPEQRLAYQENAGDWGLYEPMRAKYAGYNIQFLQKSADIIGGLSVLFKCLPGDGTPVKANADRFAWAYGSGDVITKPMAEETYDLIDPVRFALLSYHLITGEMYRMTCYIPEGHIANQQIEGISNCFRYMCLYKDFTFVEKYLDDAIASLNRTFGVSFYRDGGVIEKSFNYNYGTVDTVASVTKFAQMAPEFSKKLGTVGNVESYWNRLVDGYSINTGILPNVGNQTIVGTEDVWTNLAKKTERETALAKNTSLAFESVAYPYSGYVASRNGWDLDDLSLSFFNNDYRSSGHYITGTNAILSLSAYGRTMLLSGGSPWYGTEYLSEANAKFLPWYDEVNGYMAEESSRKLSNVMVNDCSQSSWNESFNPILKRNYVFAVNKGVIQAPDEVLPYRWGTNNSFDFTEGKWQGGYTNDDQSSSVKHLVTGSDVISGRMADHYRNIIFVKDANIWLVFDELENMNGKKNTYSQVWNFAGYLEENSELRGYTDEQMVLDEENSIVKTADPNGPNLNIISVSDNDLSYKMYYGYKEEGKRGRGWSRGGKDNDLAGYTARPDVYVNWEDSGKIGEKTKVLSILAPTEDMSDPIKELKNLSEGDLTHYYIETANGVKMNYYSSPTARIYKERNVEIMAKTVLLTEQDGKIKGIILDGEYLQMSGTVSKYNTYKNFIFEIGENGYLADTAEIAIPETFGWTDNADGTYTPYYNENQQKKTQAAGKNKELKFHDIEEHWGKDAIEALADKDIIKKELVYYPNKAITRGDFIKMVILAIGKGESEYRDIFKDCSNITDNIGYLITAYDLGIISGDEQGNANTSSNLTREQMTKIIAKAFELSGSQELGFTDKESISDWATEYVEAACNAGAVKGTEENKFNPQGKFTRAEAASVIYNLIG